MNTTNKKKAMLGDDAMAGMLLSDPQTDKKKGKKDSKEKKAGG